MNVRFVHRGVHPLLVGENLPLLHGVLSYDLIHLFKCTGRQHTKRPVQKREIHRRLHAQPNEILQKLTGVDPNNDIAITVAFDEHHDQRSQQLLRRITLAAFSRRGQ